MSTASTRAVFLLLALLAGCGSPSDRATPTATASASGASAPSGAPSASTAAQRAPDKSALLRSGRKLAQAGQWKEAAEELNLARSIDPDDAIILSELGFAQMNAGDLAVSQEISEHALTVAKEPRVRAQIFYNLGRVAEAKGDKETAKKRYEESLSLRANHAVQARLESLGGKAAEGAGVPPPPTLPCDREFPNTQALCDCLLAPQKLDLPNDAKPICRAERSAPKLDSGELSVLRWGAEEGAVGEALQLLVSNAKGGLRPMVQLGRDFDSGGTGVSSHTKVIGFEERTTGGRHVVLVRTEQKDVDENEGDHGLYTTRVLRVTACVLRDEQQRDTKCPLSVPLEMDDSLSYDRAKGGGYDRKARFELVLAARKATLKLVSGAESLAPKSTLGPHVLW